MVQMLIRARSANPSRSLEQRLTHTACDGNDPNNLLNWKHGGTLGDGPLRYGIYPEIDQGYRPSSCSFHIRENQSWRGVDGPGTKRTWSFSIQQLRMLDHDKQEIGRAGFKKNSGDGDPIKCGDANLYSWGQGCLITCALRPTHGGIMCSLILGRGVGRRITTMGLCSALWVIGAVI